ncbi:alpha/beta hydrolase family protein [Lentzea sp. NPDC058436]|uniref:alpha/beta hydrolase family protein n=1 Tax=Lentzea sp. NPDC058436 TaxID=3346499 RepID=UPI00364F2BB2
MSDARRAAGRRVAAPMAVLVATLAGLLGPAPVVNAAGSSAAVAPCPANVGEKATCYTGQDANGAYFTMAVPKKWNGSLVVHAHGGPDFAYDSSSTDEELERWAVMVDEGYAWAASSYRRGGYGVRMAAADTENVRQLFVERFGKPARTYLHGQSFGGNVAAKVAETYAKKPGLYDGVLLTNGLLAGGSRGYDHRVDLRVVYQYYCGNLPRPTEPQYPLWQGLPADSTLTPEDVLGRLQECTGIDSDAAERTEAQQRNLSEIVAVTRMSEDTLATNLLYATFLFQDIVFKRLDGGNPFGNRGVHYDGSRDDAALNAGVARFSADRTARRDLSYDADLTGKITLPVLTLHAIHDPQVYVEHEAAYRETVRRAGRADDLVQTFTNESDHSELSTAEYANSIAALDSWVRSGRRPTARSIADSCGAFDKSYGSGCFYDPGFSPESYASQVRPRPGGQNWPVMTAAEEAVWSRVPGIGIAP